MIQRTEDQEQEMIFDWAEAIKPRDHRLENLFAIPNGGYRSKATAARLKATGVRAGVPDMCLAYPSGEYHGLFVELKRADGGVLSPAQKIWIERLRLLGYKACVAHGHEEAIRIIMDYLDPEEDDDD